MSIMGVKAQTSDSLIVDIMRKEGVSFSHDNSVTLLTSGREKFQDMFAAIRQARKSIHLEYFNFRNDSIANALFDLLAQKVTEGVEVRALFDGFGNDSNNRPLRKKHVEYQRSRGIQLYEFDPIRFPWINHVFHRDHRKIVVIDGRIAYTGGMNVADYYIKGTEVVGEWHDMHCRIEGEEVNTLQRIFLRMWNRVTGENVSGDQYFRQVWDNSAFTRLKPDTTSTAGRKMVGIANREPHRTPKVMRRFYVGAINSAKDSIKLLNPYLTLTHSVKKAIKRALKRGVKFEVMLAEKSDIPLTPDCAFYNLHWMMKKGAEVWIFQGGFHHTKVIMVDGKFCTVGSTNLDARSLRWDYEENAIIIDKPTTHELSTLFDRDKQRSFRLNRDNWKTWKS
ncbi:MAG: phospholipase D-like domain-containing protein, partial [Prevotella sp.]|nr:phospholipase D-like domain-containing protein [Prevotella sp.]